MNKKNAKQLIVAVILTSWLATPMSVLADSRVELTGNNAQTQTGISNSAYDGNFGGAVYNSGTNKTISGDFSGNSAHVSGGALENAIGSASTITSNSSFANNSINTAEIKQSFGGAIDNKGQLTIADGTATVHVSFTGNTAGAGGALYNYATGIPTYIGDYTSFDNNSTNRAYGSAVYTRSGLDIGDNVSFTNNTAQWGGALASEMVGTASMPDPAVTTINIGKNVLFQNNIADWSKTSWAMGGAIINTNGTINIGDGANFIGNKAVYGGAIANKQDSPTGPASVITLGQSTFQNNQAVNGMGGAIFNAASMSIGPSTFDSNAATKSNGGAIANLGTMTITGTQENQAKFTNNTAGGAGGAIYNQGNMTIDNALFNNNSTNADGGAIQNNVAINNGVYGDSNLTITNSTFTDNQALKYIGGAISVANGKVSIDNSNFTGNKAAWGGAIYTYTGNKKGVEVAISNSLFEGNEALSVGAIGNFASTKLDPKGGMTLTNVTFKDNKATDASDDGAGALFVGSESKTNVIGSTFTGNTSASVGGAIATRVAQNANGTKNNNSAGTLDITGSTFTSNIAATNGGAIDNYFYNSKNSAGTVYIANTSFSSNQANSGGAIYNHSLTDNQGNGGNMTLLNATFTGNTSTSNGGAIYNEAVMALNGTTSFTTNSAGGQGGAIFNQGGTVNIMPVSATDTIVFDGNSSAQGGAISNYANGNITIGDGVSFINNHSINAGAISNSFANITIGNNAKFENNYSEHYAGAILNQSGNVTIGNNAIFKNNQTNKNGGTDSGGVIATESNNSQATSNTIIGNSALFESNSSGRSGGALYVFESSGLSSLQIGDNATFKSNKTFGTDGKNGGAIAIYGAEGTNVNGKQGVTIGNGATFEQNSSVLAGGAIYLTNWSSTNAQLSLGGNTSFTNNTAGTKGGAIYNAAIVNVDTSVGDVTFSGNTDSTGNNDIFMDDDSTLNITGSNKVSLAGGVSSNATSTAVINNASNLILGSGSVNQNYKGIYNQTAGDAIVNSSFFGGTSNITGGNVLLNSGSEIVAGSTVNLGSNTNININSDVNSVGTVAINGAIASVANGDGAITLAAGNLIIDGNQSGFTGTFNQNGDASTTTTITANGTFFGGTNNINKGKFVIKQGATLAADVNIKDYAVALDLDGRDYVLSDGGINITGHAIKGSLNLEDTKVIVDPSKGIQSDLYIANGSTIGNSGATPSAVGVGDSTHNVTLSLGSGADLGQTSSLAVADGSKVNLTPTEAGTLNLNTAITGSTGSTVIVQGTEINGQTYNVGNVKINSDNSAFQGTFEQNDGVVTVASGSTFFGGTNNVNTDDSKGLAGALVLEQGANLASSVNINGDANAEALDVANATIKGDVVGGVTQSTITSGTVATAGSTVQVNNAGLMLSNNTVISENTLNLNSTSGVRTLGLSDGSGVNGNVELGDSTAIVYGDNAFVKADSSINMTNADLAFDNKSTDLNYNPTITGTGTITKGGSATTTVASALNSGINVSTYEGTLNLANKDTSSIGSISALSNASNPKNNPVINIAASKATVGDIRVIGANSTVNFQGDIKGGDTVVEHGTIGIFGQSSLNTLSLGSTLNMASNNQINNLSVNDITLTGDSNFTFDADPRSNLTDTINAQTYTDGGHKLIITGINMTQSPIDSQFGINTNNILTSADGNKATIELQNGSILANTPMGQYLLTSSGSSGLISANLVNINPQMYRGQVATVASYANQLVVNNILFDHMNILANDLIARDNNANRYAATNPLFAPYQYSKKDGDLWFKAYGNFERISMTNNLNVGNNAYGSIIGADFPLLDMANGWKLVPTAYIAYNGGHQTFDGVSMYQNGAQLGAMGTAYKGNLITSLSAYGGGYANDMSVGGASDNTGNWFAGVASKTAYNIHLPKDLILQPTALVSYNIFGNQNYHSNFGNMSMNSGFLNGINVAPGVNLIWNKETFSLYATAQLVYNIMGNVSGKAGNIDLNDVRMRSAYFEYGIGAMKRFKDRFTGYVQITLRNGNRTGIGFQGGLQWKIGK